jgi:hypothetical protein|tara:strand:+ start:226 stop:384 length:159 start_codon:yes stop_codon:yes gene_type:complete
MKQLNHFNVSIIKSIIRLVGYGLLLSNTFIAVIILIISELLGVLEELVEENK